MSEHDVLFSITEDGRDGINFQVWGSEIDNILNQKEDVLEVMERLKKALINETYPFTRIKKK
jgi:benzoyl-CoA reductase/2-hydroxyglutaryl-CoA dehydratase subunit BcrC/BadD/HgdB